MPRNDHAVGPHPDPELLAARATGLLAAEAAARVDAHVAGCPVCGLEMARAARFAHLDRDEDTAAAADWEAARKRLDAAWHSVVWPAVAPRRRRFPRWFVPAAAAVLVLVAIGVGDRFWRPAGSPGADAVRGLPAAAPAIRPLAPTGRQETAPARFAWVADRGFQAFALEIFTAELGTVLRLEDLRHPQTDLPDSVRDRLEPGVTYFWHVEGWEGLNAAEASPTVSFHIAPPRD